MTVISLKDYARQNNISYEAVRQQVVRYAGELGEHIIRDGRQQFLDEEAVAFLDGKRQKNPVVIVQQDKDKTIEDLKLERDGLLVKVTEYSDKVAKLSEWKADNAVAIAEANQRQQLLEERSTQIAELKGQNADLKAERDKAKESLSEAEKKAEKLSDELTEAKKQIDVGAKALEKTNIALCDTLRERDELLEYASLPFWKRLFTKPPVKNKE